jgi:protein-L-isoaspartate(D-aspartate) O-methyltransferase
MDNKKMVDLACQNRFYLSLKQPRDPKVRQAMLAVDRAMFVPQGPDVYRDTPLDIGYSQTCSEPSCVAFMDDVLMLGPDCKVLEVGTGCGYHAAVTAGILSAGRLYSIEMIDQLKERSEQNLRQHFDGTLDDRMTLIKGDGSVGLSEHAPYDRIYLTAGIDPKKFSPGPLIEQLNPELGILLMPVRFGILTRLVYVQAQLVDRTDYRGIYFVPLLGRNS